MKRCLVTLLLLTAACGGRLERPTQNEAVKEETEVYCSVRLTCGTYVGDCQKDHETPHLTDASVQSFCTQAQVDACLVDLEQASCLEILHGGLPESCNQC